MTRTGIGKLFVIALALLAAGGCVSLADLWLNQAVIPPPYSVGSETRAFHNDLFIADLHADTLLWNRDIFRRASHGYVDLPRLREGHIGLQVFGVVTQVPLFLRMDHNGDRPDAVQALARSQHWPESASTPLGRALYQAEKLKAWAGNSGGSLRLIQSRRDLEELLAARARGEVVIGAMLNLEGAHALEGELANLELLHAAGYRILGLSHFFDNPFAGSAHGKAKGGLTPLGKALVAEVERRGMIIDLAHASPKAIEDTLTIATRPVLASHGGLRGTCDSVRNLSDGQLRAMRYAADLVGIEHVALGSDWDGSRALIDASGLPLLTEGLIQAGFSREEIGAILGGNLLRVLRATLP